MKINKLNHLLEIALECGREAAQLNTAGVALTPFALDGDVEEIEAIAGASWNELDERVLYLLKDAWLEGAESELQ